jgi:hypothetical protein
MISRRNEEIDGARFEDGATRFIGVPIDFDLTCSESDHPDTGIIGHPPTRGSPTLAEETAWASWSWLSINTGRFF